MYNLKLKNCEVFLFSIVMPTVNETAAAPV